MNMILHTKDLIDACAHLNMQSFITVDTEFMRENTYYPQLCLIQVASPHMGFLIDPLSNGLDLSPLWDVMRNEKVLKVFHASRQDIEIFTYYKATPSPVFDTQVAAMAYGYGDQIAYDQLVRELLKVEIDKGSRYTDWSRRPLNDDQLQYALGDVTHLAKLYPMLREKLETKGRLEWVSEEMLALCAPEFYISDPDVAWKRLKPRKYSVKYLAVFAQLAKWRELTAQKNDLPRGRVMKDEAIDEMATQLPQSAQAFDQLRSVTKGFGNSKFGLEISQLIKTALASPDIYAPKIDKPSHAPSAPSGVIEMLKLLLKIRCDEEGVSSKLIATVSDLEKIALDDHADVAALKGWRRSVFGEDALRLKSEKLGIALYKGKIKLIDLSA